MQEEKIQSKNGIVRRLTASDKNALGDDILSNFNASSTWSDGKTKISS